jgi:hypothetical protein
LLLIGKAKALAIQGAPVDDLGSSVVQTQEAESGAYWHIWLVPETKNKLHEIAAFGSISYGFLLSS